MMPFHTRFTLQCEQENDGLGTDGALASKLGLTPFCHGNQGAAKVNYLFSLMNKKYAPDIGFS